MSAQNDEYAQTATSAMSKTLRKSALPPDN
jgi:hypothetical protein